MDNEEKPKEISFDRNVVISGKIHCRTGLRIGGLQEEVKIGGVENVVIRDPLTDKPIIPGSSLKGKLRSILELNEKAYSRDGRPHSHSEKEKCSDENCKICRIFGSSSDTKRGPTRLIVRDSFLLSDLEEDVEVKAENVINRLTGKAESPRFMERVPAGAEFGLEMIYGVYGKDDLDDLRIVFELINQLQDSYLGGSGSRGYGKIEFRDITLEVRTKAHYEEGKPGEKIVLEGKSEFTPAELVAKFGTIKEKIRGK